MEVVWVSCVGTPRRHPFWGGLSGEVGGQTGNQIIVVCVEINVMGCVHRKQESKPRIGNNMRMIWVWPKSQDASGK